MDTETQPKPHPVGFEVRPSVFTTNDPRYDFDTTIKRLVRSTTGCPVDDDVPVHMLVATDLAAHIGVEQYVEEVYDYRPAKGDSERLEAIGVAFNQFYADHRERMVLPEYAEREQGDQDHLAGLAISLYEKRQVVQGLEPKTTALMEYAKALDQRLDTYITPELAGTGDRRYIRKAVRDHLLRHQAKTLGLHEDAVAWACGTGPDVTVEDMVERVLAFAQVITNVHNDLQFLQS